MAEHRIKRDGIIYTIPNDELFEKLKSGDATIDKQGHLVDKKTGNIIKWLDFRADEDTAHEKCPLPQPPIKSEPTVSDGLKQIAVNAFLDVSEELIDRAVDKFFYEVLPGVWKEHIVPFCHDVKVDTRPYCSSDNTLVNIGVVIMVIPRCMKLQMVNQKPAFTGNDIFLYFF